MWLQVSHACGLTVEAKACSGRRAKRPALLVVEDERLFSHMNYIKSGIRNKLGEEFLQASLRIAVQNEFDADTFPYEKALVEWHAVKDRRERESKKRSGSRKRRQQLHFQGSNKKKRAAK